MTAIAASFESPAKFLAGHREPGRSPRFGLQPHELTALLFNAPLSVYAASRSGHCHGCSSRLAIGFSQLALKGLTYVLEQLDLATATVCFYVNLVVLLDFGDQLTF